MKDVKMNEWFDIEGFGGMYKINKNGEYLKIAPSNIINCCKHRKYNKTAKGYHFEYYGGI